MKKVLHLTCLLVAVLFGKCAVGQQINKAEYFFDSDPGIGKGTAITISSAGDSIDITSSVSTTGLTIGFHSFFVRVKNTSGVWSLYEGRNFYLYPTIATQPATINKAEYFFDSDPGLGKGTAVTVSTPGDSVDVNSTVSTAGLSEGFHSFFVRVKNDSGVWSLYEGRNFYLYNNAISTPPVINTAEYFFDTDPGLGKGAAITVSTPGDSVDVSSTAGISALSQGFHSFFVRVKNDSGVWSLYEGRNFYIENPVPLSSIQLVKAEAFFDTDPGFGNGIAVSPAFSPADSVNLFRSVSAVGLALGGHNLFVRVQNDSGQWSMPMRDTFQIANPCSGVNITGSSAQVCKGDSATLTATGGTGYTWSNGDTTAKIKVSPVTSDTFSVLVTNTGCASDTLIVVDVNPLPVISITSSGNTLTASGATSYSWNTGSTNDTIVVHKTGRYTVTGTNSSGCSDTASYYIVVTGIAEINSNEDQVSLYPNPNNGEFTLLYHLTSSNEQLRIVDITGRIVYEENLSATVGIKQVDATDLNNGLFFWQILSANQLAAEGKITVIK